MKNSVEINDKKSLLKQRCKEIVDTCKIEIREMTDAEKEEFEQNKEEIKALNEELEELKAKLRAYDEELPETEDEEKEETEDNKQARNFINTKSNTNMEFRLVKAIRDIANNRNLDETAQAVVESGAKEMRKAGVSFGGQIQLPTETRAAITVASEGEDVVATNLYNIIEPLRAKNVLVQAGAKFISGLVGNVQIPVMSGANVAWATETGAATDGAGSFTSKSLSPKRLTAFIDLSKQFLVQDSLDAEALIRQDLINAINSKLEATILGDAAATATAPAGIFSLGVAPTINDFGELTALEATVEAANVYGEMKYIMSPSAKAGFRNMAKSTKSNELVMQGGEIDGTPVLVSSNVSTTQFVYGDFSNLAIGQFGGIDLVVDPYTKAAEGQVRLVVNAYFDAVVLRPVAFAIGKL